MRIQGNDITNLNDTEGEIPAAYANRRVFLYQAWSVSNTSTTFGLFTRIRLHVISQIVIPFAKMCQELRKSRDSTAANHLRSRHMSTCRARTRVHGFRRPAFYCCLTKLEMFSTWLDTNRSENILCGNGLGTIFNERNGSTVRLANWMEMCLSLFSAKTSVEIQSGEKVECTTSHRHCAFRLSIWNVCANVLKWHDTNGILRHT